MITPFYFIIALVFTAVAAFMLGRFFMPSRIKIRVDGNLTSPVEDCSDVLKHNLKMWSIFSDAMPIHVFIKNADDDFRYIYSNKTRNDFFGLSSDELIGKNDMVLLPLEAAKAQLLVDTEIMTKPQGIYRGQYEGNGSDGKKRIFRIVQTQFTSKSGKHFLLGAALDITEQEETSRALAEATRLLEERERWLSRTLQSIGDAVIVTDKSGNTVLMNPVAERLIGVNANDAIGKPHDEVFHIEGATDHEPRLSPVGRALRTGAIVELANNTDLVSVDGTRYHISDSVAPIMDEQKKILGAVLVFRDVTEAYRHRAALNTAVNNWEIASKVSGIASFRIDYKTRKILSSSQRLSEYWPLKDGCAVPPEEWVFPEDIANGRGLMTAVAEGRREHNFIQYRVCKDGKIRHYRMYGAIDPEHPGEVTGIIQNITEAYESEMQLQNTRLMWNSFLDILPLNFFAKNADDHFRYTHCNKRFAEFVGKSIEDIVGKTDAELFQHQCDSEQFLSQDVAIVKSGESKNFTESVWGAGKDQITYQTVKMPCVGPNGEQLLLGVSIDITNLAVLSKSQEILRQGLEMLVAETDVNDGIAKALKLVCEYMGVSRSYILHFDTERKTVSCVREYCKPGEPELLNNLQDKPYSTDVNWQKHFEKECFLNVPNLQSAEILTSLGSFYEKLIKKGDFRSLYCHRLIIDGKFWGYVGLAYRNNVRILNQRELDFVQSAARFIELMIRHKRAQTKLHDAVIQAQVAEKAKSRFLATMSHEIRTPLNAVIGFSEILKDNALSVDEKNEYLNDISIAGNSLLSLINDILDISKLEAGKMQFAKKMTDFSDVVHEIMVIFRQKFKEKQLKEIIHIDALPMVEIDPLRMRQILFNLVGNAVKFTDAGTITVSAKFQPGASEHTGTLFISVKDTGCGISDEDKTRLFQPFAQSGAIAGTQKAGCGSGLGLLLVRRMLEFMNGEITLETELGKGSEFIVVLNEIKWTEKTENLSEVQDKSEELSVAHPLSVLVVDDVKMNLKVLSVMLKSLGSKISVLTASNSDEAWDTMEKNEVDFLLTDLWMPGMNGAELSAKIRRSGKYPNLIIAALTADVDGRENFDMSMFDALLTKPVSIKKLKQFMMEFDRKHE